MSTLFTLQNGNLDDYLIYGYPISGSDISNNTTGTLLLTSNIYSTTSYSEGYPISAIAINLSSRNSNPSGTLGLTIQKTPNPKVFLDNSSNKLTVTNPAATAYQIPFTPYSPNGWSASFDGSTSYVRIPNTPINLSAGDFTIELFAYFNNFAGSTRLLCESWTPNIGWQLFYRGSNSLVVFASGSNTSTVAESVSSVVIGKWYHIAVTRQNTTLRLFIDGIQKNSTTVGTGAVTASQPFNIGSQSSSNTNYYSGNISNVRIVNNQAIYTTNFTPPTAKLGLTHNGGAIGATTTPISTNVEILTLQDNRFIDNSTKNYSLLVGSTTTLIKDASPFSSQIINPSIYGGSVFLNGGPTDYLISNSNTAFNLSGFPYTVEFWINPSVLGITQGLVNLNTGTNQGLNIYITGSDLYFDNGVTTASGSRTTNTPLVTGIWTHVALVGTNETNHILYVNGLSSVKYTSKLITTIPNKIIIGNTGNLNLPYKGYISDIRIVKGTAVYTSNFTPSALLTNIDGTTFLLNTNNYPYNIQSFPTETYAISSFTNYDGSNNQLTPYPQSWQTLKLTNPLSTNIGDFITYSLSTSNPNQLNLIGNPFFSIDYTNINSINTTGSPILTSYKPYSNFLNSYYLNGSTDWLTIPANSNFNFTGDFTIECWVNTSTFNQDTVNRRLFCFGVDNVANLQLIFYGGSTPNISLYSSTTLIDGTISVANGIWHHLAISRYNGLLRLYVDGVKSGNAINNTTIFNYGVTNPLLIGKYADQNYGKFNGYINEFRIVNGTAVYTTPAFTPPTAPLEYIPNTVFLLKNGNKFNQAILASSSVLTGNVTNTGTVTLSSANPFGDESDGSMYFSGSNNLSIPHEDRLNFNNDFTIEFWCYRSLNSGTRFFCSKGSGFQLYTAGNDILRLTIQSPLGTVIINGPDSGISITPNIWNHIAVCVKNQTYYVCGNGKALPQPFNGSASFAYPDGGTTAFQIGAISDGSRFSGYISNFRYIKGNALYVNTTSPTSSTYVVPTSPLSIYFNTALFLKYPYSLSTFQYTPDATDIHIGSCLKGLSSESRSITASNLSINNLYIHKDGTLNFPLTSTTLNIYGDNGIQITQEGTLNIGTSSSYVPLSTTHTINLDNTQIDVHNYGNLNIYGYPKLTTTSLVSTHGIGSRRFTTTNNISSEWNVSDILVFKPNISARTSFDQLTLSSFVDSNIFTTTSNSLCTHTGSADQYSFIPDVYNLSRNVKIQGLNSTNRGTIRTISAAKTSINYAQLSNFGVDSINKNGFVLENNLSGSTTLSGISIQTDGLTNIYNIVNPDNYYSGYFNLSTYITYPSYPAISFPASTLFTIEGWIYPISATALNSICMKRTQPNGAGSTTNYSTTLRNGYLSFDNGTTVVNTVSTVSLNKWTHCAWVYNGTAITMYINGISAGFGTISLNADAGTSLIFGADGHSSDSYAPFYGYLSNFRIIRNLNLYTSNFTPPTGPLKNYNLTGSFSTVFLGLYNILSSLNDYSIYNGGSATIWKSGVSTLSATVATKFSPFNKQTNNLTVNSSIFYKQLYPIEFYSKLNNVTFSNNYILSSASTGILLQNLSGSPNISNNTTIAALSYGTILLNNTLTGTYGSINYNSGLQGMLLSSTSITGIIVGGGINSGQEGVYVDTTTNNLSSVNFQNIVAFNNSSVGFKVSGNNLNPLTPITLNINGLTANNNLNAGIEAYNITGNLTSLNLSNNTSGSKISIGNGNTIFDGLTSILSATPLSILSGYNYNQTIIKNSLLSSSNNPALILDSTKFSEFKLDNCILSGTSPISFFTTRNLLEGSYLINNSYLGATPLGTGIISKYQAYAIRSTGFAFTSLNKISSLNVTYFTHGERSSDNLIAENSSEYPTERLTPYSRNIKLRSGSKYVALDNGDSTLIAVKVRKSISTGGETEYNGNPPRLILKSNPSMGIYTDYILDELTSVNNVSGSFVELTGGTPAVINDGVLEFYVDCDGSQGWINIDNWEVT